MNVIDDRYHYKFSRSYGGSDYGECSRSSNYIATHTSINCISSCADDIFPEKETVK